jgi:hypothetical protein
MAPGWNRSHGQTVMRQNVVDGFVVIFTQTLEYHEVRGAHGQEELGHDFVGTAQVDQLDV